MRKRGFYFLTSLNLRSASSIISSRSLRCACNFSFLSMKFLILSCSNLRVISACFSWFSYATFSKALSMRSSLSCLAFCRSYFSFFIRYSNCFRRGLSLSSWSKTGLSWRGSKSTDRFSLSLSLPALSAPFKPDNF
jgi:hypothetical protein